MELTDRLQPEWVEFTHGKHTIGLLLQPLTAAQFMNCRGIAEKAVGDGLMETVRCAVSDWRGVVKGGEPVPFSKQGLNALFSPPSRAALLAQVANAVMSRSLLTEDEEKK